MSESRRGDLFQRALRALQGGIPGRKAELWDSKHPGDNWLSDRAEWLVKSLGVSKYLRPKIEFDSTDRTKVVSGVTVVDVGAGKGHIMDEIDQQLPGSHVIGVDPHDDQTAIVRKRGEQLGNNIEYLDETQHAESMSRVEGGSVDGIVMSFVLHHLNEHERTRALREAIRVLKPDGYVFIAEDVAENEQERQMAEAYDRILNADATDNSAHTYLSLEEWKNLFIGAGLDIVESNIKKPGKVTHGFFVLKKRVEEGAH